MPGDDSENTEEKITLEELAKGDIEEKSRPIKDLIKIEEREQRKDVRNGKIFFAVFVVMLTVIIACIFLWPGSDVCILSGFMAIASGLGAYGSARRQYDRSLGAYEYKASFSLSERYKYYFYNMYTQLQKYNDVKDDSLKLEEGKKVKKRLTRLYNLTWSWNEITIRENTIYFDLFSKNILEFNINLRKLIYRINGYICEKKEIPSRLFQELFALITELDSNTSVLTNLIEVDLKNALEILENKETGLYREIYEESKLKRKLKASWSKGRKLIVSSVALVIASCSYLAIVTFFDLGIDTNAKFNGLMAVIGTTVVVIATVLLQRK